MEQTKPTSIVLYTLVSILLLSMGLFAGFYLNNTLSPTAEIVACEADAAEAAVAACATDLLQYSFLIEQNQISSAEEFGRGVVVQVSDTLVTYLPFSAFAEDDTETIAFSSDTVFLKLEAKTQSDFQFELDDYFLNYDRLPDGLRYAPNALPRPYVETVVDVAALVPGDVVLITDRSYGVR